MKTKIILTLFILAFAVIQLKAQSHNTRGGSWCKFVKSAARDESESARCLACDAIDKKEQAARDAENKRRNDAIKAEYEAKEKKRQLALKKEKEERDAKNKSTELSINMPNSIVGKNKMTDKKPVPKEMEKHYFYTEKNDIDNQSLYEMYLPKEERNQNSSNYFIINNEKKFTNNEFKACIGSIWKHRDREEFNFPPNIGIVVLNEEFTDNNGSKVQITDLIDSKGNRILNDNSISTIIHFADDYFIAIRGNSSGRRSGSNMVSFFTNSGESFIYNLKTKQKYPIPRYTSNGTEIRWYEFDFIVSLGSQDIDKSKYKARFRSSLNQRESIYYFITQDGKLEEQVK